MKPSYTKRNIAPNSIWVNPWHFIAFGFGTGAIPFAPGTFGTILGALLYLLLPKLHFLTYAALTLIIIIASILICDKVSEDIAVHDHQGMCLDEVAGFFVVMLGIPHDIFWVVLGIILFRIFDIWKPWPINYLDKNVSGGFGMIIDDVLAALFACFILHFLVWL